MLIRLAWRKRGDDGAHCDDFCVSLQKMVCHGQHTYIYAQVMLQILSQEAKGGNNIRRLQQEITKYAITRWGPWGVVLVMEISFKVFSWWR